MYRKLESSYDGNVQKADCDGLVIPHHEFAHNAVKEIVQNSRNSGLRHDGCNAQIIAEARKARENRRSAKFPQAG